MADLSEESLSEYYEIVSRLFVSKDEGFCVTTNILLIKSSVFAKAMLSGTILANRLSLGNLFALERFP